MTSGDVDGMAGWRGGGDTKQDSKHGMTTGGKWRASPLRAKLASLVWEPSVDR
jgi:hypothetical protein